MATSLCFCIAPAVLPAACCLGIEHARMQHAVRTGSRRSARARTRESHAQLACVRASAIYKASTGRVTSTHTHTRARTNERANEPNQRSDDALIVYNTCRLYNSWLACKRRCVTLLLPPSQPACQPASLLNCCDCRYCFCCCCCLIASIEPQRAPPSPFRIGCSRKHSLRARTHTHTGDRPIARLRESERAKQQQQQQRNATLIAQTK